MRQRERLLEYAASHIQHMQKALTEMNVQLHHVVADITGATTGLRIIRAILAGERAPEVLAAKPFYLLAGAGAVQQDLRRQNAIVTERAGPAAAPGPFDRGADQAVRPGSSTSTSAIDRPAAEFAKTENQRLAPVEQRRVRCGGAPPAKG